MSKRHIDSGATQEKKDTDGPCSSTSPSASPLGRRELLIIAGQTAAAVALAACDGKESQIPGSDMGMGADMLGESPDMRVLPPDMRPPRDLMPPPDMTFICMPTVATGAEMLAVDQAKNFYLPANRSFLVARDAKGFFALRNVCTHSGCQTAVNAVAKSYDCPCHGSRFSLDGTVLQGPAIDPLLSYPMVKLGDGTLEVDPCGNGSTDRSGRVT